MLQVINAIAADGNDAAKPAGLTIVETMKYAPPLRILHLTSGSDAGGVSRYLYDLCKNMHEAGHRVAIAGEKGVWHDLFASAPWPWIEVPLKGNPLQLAMAKRTLRQYLDANPVDVLHAHYRKATLVARRLRTRAAAPLLYTLHGSHISFGGPWKWLSDFGDHVHTASSEARQWLMDQAHVPSEKITVIPHGIDPQKFPVPNAETRKALRAKYGLTDQDRAVLLVGRMENTKNEDWMIDLAAAARDKLPNLRILMVGNGPYEDVLRQRIERENLSQQVRLMGWCDPLPLYQAADALMLPSPKEGFSLVCAEAMCAGLPVLRARTSGTAALILEHVTGVSVPIERQAFLQAGIDFMSDPQALTRMGTAAAEHIRKNFTFDHQIEQTVELYRRLACGLG